MEKDLREILSAGVAAADPREAVLRAVRMEDGTIVAGDARFEAHRVFVLAAGKAAGAMAAAAEELLGDRLAGGLIVTKTGNEVASETLEVVFASHPEPDEGGVEAARKAQELAESLGEDDLLLALISGGASALLADPTPPIELADLKELTQALLRSGANISEINAIRKHVSVLKGGGLAHLAAPAGDPRPPPLRRSGRRALGDSERPRRPGRHHPGRRHGRAQALPYRATGEHPQGTWRAPRRRRGPSTRSSRA